MKKGWISYNGFELLSGPVPFSMLFKKKGWISYNGFELTRSPTGEWSMELVLTEFGTSLGKRSRRLVIRRKGKAAVEVPASEVTNILVTGKGITVSSDALSLAARHGVVITFLNYRGEPYAKVIPPESFGRAALRRQQLLAVEDGRGVALAKAFLEGKLRNQAANLRYFGKSRKKSAPKTFEQLRAASVEVDRLLEEMLALPGRSLSELRTSLMNREARAARAYWSGIRAVLPAAAHFEKRKRRGAKDPFNACLNYGYGILYSRIWSVLMVVGLDPYAGFLHAYRDNKPTLVFDFIEEFRQMAVDRVMVASFSKGWLPAFDEEGHLDGASRKKLATRVLKRLNQRMRYEGRETKLVDLIKSEAREIAAVLLNAQAHRPYVAAW